jgi:hypothetical protein
VVYKGFVEATMNDLRDLIDLAHELYISIPISDDLIRSLDLNLTPMPPFGPRNLLPRLKQRPNIFQNSNNNLALSPPSLKMPTKSQMNSIGNYNIGRTFLK